jgi:RHS repeat-associated protein
MYDASGKLLRTETSTGKTTDYVGNLTYENNVLYQISHDEGRINSAGQYEYDIYDHAKNLRVSFRDSSGIAKIVTKFDYDPWGYRLKGLDYYANSLTYNKFKTFSGKELHEDFGFNLLSYKFRFHDPALGRFISIDPLAEQYNYNSTFAFAENKLGLGMEYEGLEMAPFEQMHARQVIEQNKKGMTATQAQNYEAHGNKVAITFVGGALSAGIAVATLPTTALVGATTGSGISGSLTAIDGGSKTQIMNSVVTGGIAGAITGGGGAVATKLGGSESIKVALNAASGYVAGATESAVSQTLNNGKVNSGDVVRAATVSSVFTVIGGKLGNLVDNVVSKVPTNTTLQQFGKEVSNIFKDFFLGKTSNDINDTIKTEKK